ncbi:DUF4282 domain-containing protein [Candidatus Nitrospira bockiana]
MASRAESGVPRTELTCPKCGSEHPARTLKCGCGHQFMPVQEQPIWTLEQDAPIPEQGFFSFRVFVTPAVIRVVYLLGVLGLTAASVAIALIPPSQLLPELRIPANVPIPPTVKPIVGAVLVFLLGNVLWRVLCELVMILFSLHAALLAIHRRLKRRG